MIHKHVLILCDAAPRSKSSVYVYPEIQVRKYITFLSFTNHRVNLILIGNASYSTFFMIFFVKKFT